MAVFERLKVGLDSFFNWLGQSSLRAACFAQLWPLTSFLLVWWFKSNVMVALVEDGHKIWAMALFSPFLAAVPFFACFCTYMMLLAVPPRDPDRRLCLSKIRGIVILVTTAWTVASLKLLLPWAH